MGALATDSFTRADAANLGANWTGTGEGTATGYKIVSNAVANTGDGGADEWAKYTAVTWPNDQYSQAAVTISVAGGGTGDGEGVGVRIAAGATKTLYRFVVNSNAGGSAEVSKFVAGTYTQLGTRTPTYSAGQLVYGEIQGSTLVMKYNGVQLGASLSDSSIASGSAGLAHSGPGVTLTTALDNWEGGDFSGAADPFPAGYRLRRFQPPNRQTLFAR
jgi:hypothetical protein